MTAAGCFAPSSSIPDVEGFARFGDVLAGLIDELKPHNCGRFNVIRTRFTAEREPIPRWLRIAVYKRDNFCCVWCGSPGRLELDHILPWSAGGPDTFDNLRTLCHSCNTYRSNTGRSTDLMCRQLPGGMQCVNCNPDIIGDPELRPIFCITCGEKTCGIRSAAKPPPGWEEEQVA